LRVALTGGVACGKTVVAQMFARRGVHLLQADEIAHRLMQPDQPVYEEVVKHFGGHIVNPDGSINRAKLAWLAFGEGKIRELNAIVHPPVIQEQERWLADLEVRQPDAIAMVEAALIFEAGVARRFDKIITVTCQDGQKLERYGLRSPGADPQAMQAEARRRIAVQWPDSEKIAASDYVIDNSGSLQATEQQVEKIYRELLKRKSK